VNDTDSPSKLTWKSPRLRLKVLVTALALAFFTYGFFTWILWPVKVLGESMMPNYRNGSHHFINKLAYRSVKPQRGDVVGVRVTNGDVYIKRVIGLPGERVTIENGRIAINGQPLREPYIDTEIPAKRRDPWELGPDEYFVAGDNRATSVLFGVGVQHIIGKVVF
jgi:signal peptidase I